MKKLITYSVAIAFVSCNSSTPATPAEASKPTETATTAIQKPADITPQLTATFKGQSLNMIGKITTQCDANNDCNSTIIVKQKNTDGDNMYELVAVLNKKIAPGTFPLTTNLFGNFIDGVNTITKGEGDTKYTTPTGYKQKGGSITFTDVTDSLVSGSFTFNVYKLSDTTITETIQGTIKNLPIKVVGE